MSTKGGHKSSSSRAETKALTNSNGAKPPAPAPINAWARPLQPKRTTAPPPGIDLTKSSTASTSSSASPPSSSSSSSSSVLVHRERLLHLSLTIVGQSVILHQKNGAIIEGIFHTFTPFSSLPIDQRNKYVLKEIIVRRQATNGAGVIKNGVTLIVPACKVSCLHAKDVATDLANNNNNSTSNKNNMNGGMSGSSSMLTSLGAVAALSQSQGTGSDGGDTFVTDTQISNSSRSGKNQDLVAAGNAWTAGGSSSNSNSNSIGDSSYKNQALGGNGSDSAGPPFQATNSRAAALAGSSKSSPGGGSAGISMSGSIGRWDQFKANKELFNVNATFDENIYTTQLDTSQLDAKKVAEAERIANEIKKTTTTNIHLAEERGFKVETDFDEEDLYSGVLTRNGKQRHEESVPKKTSREIERSSTVSKQQGPNIDSLKQNISVTSTAPTKIMNYAAAAAKADTSSNNKTAPPGFLGNNHGGEPPSSTPTTTINIITTTNDNSDKEENKAESQTFAVIPGKKTKVDVKSTQVNKSTKKAEINSSKDDTTKNDIKGKTAGTSKRSEKAVPSTNDNNKLSKDEASTPALSTRNEKVKKSGESEKDKGKEKKKEKKEDSKLNVNAKSFTFNPSAKSFTPSFGGGGANSNSASQQPPQHASTTDSSMPIYGGGHPMQPPHYMQTGPIGQPGMVPMINPQYQGMRYPPSSYGIEQTMPQMQHQPPHVQVTPSVPSDPSSGNAPTPTPGSGLSNGNEDDSTRTSRDGNDTSQKQGGGQQQPPQRSQQQQLDQPQGPPHQQQTQQQQIPIPYNVPPGAYFTAGGIPGMPPRGPGYAQFVTGPQQIAGRPGAPPYGIYPMQPGGMPHNMQMRGPNGVPFYPGPNGPIPYPPGAHMGFPMMDDGGGADFRSRVTRSSSSSSSSNNGRGRGRTRTNTGRGRSNNNNTSNYNNNNNHSSSGTSNGKNTQQQYNNYQPPQQQQQQQQSPQQEGQSTTHAHSSKANNSSPSNKADG